MSSALRRSIDAIVVASAIGLLAVQFHVAAQGPLAKDPGPRGGTSNAGGPLPNLSGSDLEYFYAGKIEFSSEEVVSDGLGPRMNLDSCAGCHLQPSVGGSSPATNPQFTFAGKNGGTDSVPPFILQNGPVRETRFVHNPDGSADGGVHAIFTIAGRSGTTGKCVLAQPDYATQLANSNVIFRIPTPTFGGGLIEAIPDSAIIANLNNTSSSRSALGIAGRPNISVAGRTITGQTNNNGNDGTISRFGWKAQNKSLLVFAGEAYNVEMGISNEVFETERDETPSCQYKSVPNDTTNTGASTPSDVLSDVEKFAMFMRMLAAPTPVTPTPGSSLVSSIGNGSRLFNSVGCALCHTPTMRTGNAAIAALAYQPVNLYSDLLVHNMGSGLADGVSQGEAGPNEFRSAPLWGLGQRLFFLHDGRASDLITAIRAHQSQGSEANGVINNFNGLSEGQKQDLLNFLRSL
ncbi:MAG TPA: di-heme oxidoredictase family protein [Vicinamibacterales bacterium]|nr:di-heme oxidoredictase family protein [Vicinamibacterales bacterium]